MSNRTGAKRSRRSLIIWIVIIAVAAIFAIRFWQVSRVESFASIRSVQQAQGKPVEVAEAETGGLEVWTALAGTVEGSFQYSIVSTNSIRIVEVAKREGERVRKGDVVIRLEKTAPNPMLHSYNRSRALYEDALRDAERMRNLYEEGAISKQALDKAEVALKVAKTDLDNATESTNLVATHPGVVTTVLAEEGEMASAHSPLVWIARIDTVKIQFEAGSRQAMALEVGQRAVWYSRETGESGEGFVSRLDLAADPSTHLLSGEAVFPNPQRRLIPGLLVSFRVLTAERAEAVKIPVGSLIGSKGDYSVFVVERGGDGKDIARLRKIETGLITSDEAEVLSGVGAGDRVVEFGKTRLFDGDLVKIVHGGGGR